MLGPAGKPLEEYQIPHEGYACDGCRQAIAKGSPAWGCRESDFDLCPVCYASAQKATLVMPDDDDDSSDGDWDGQEEDDEVLKMVRDPTTWTILEQDGPNHLGLWCNVLNEHQMALITSECVPVRC